MAEMPLPEVLKLLDEQGFAFLKVAEPEILKIQR
jgi:hypothetical protein